MGEAGMERRIAFINPFGTAAFDAIIEETLVPYAAADTVVHVIHLEGVPAQHRLLLPDAPHADGDLRQGAAARGGGLRRGRRRLLLRPGRPCRPRTRRHPGRRAARGGDEPRLVLRSLVHGRHRPPEGAALAGGPRPDPRRGELPRRPHHRLVRHRHDRGHDRPSPTTPRPPASRRSRRTRPRSSSSAARSSAAASSARS